MNKNQLPEEIQEKLEEKIDDVVSYIVNGFTKKYPDEKSEDKQFLYITEYVQAITEKVEKLYAQGFHDGIEHAQTVEEVEEIFNDVETQKEEHYE